MQIRTRNGKTEYLRPWYDKEAKRSRQRLIKPEDFTPEEQAEAEAYHAKRRQQQEEDSAAWAARTAHEGLERIAAGIEAGTLPDDAEAVWGALGRLRRAMRKAGMRQPPKVESVPETRTGKLDLD